MSWLSCFRKPLSFETLPGWDAQGCGCLETASGYASEHHWQVASSADRFSKRTQKARQWEIKTIQDIIDPSTWHTNCALIHHHSSGSERLAVPEAQEPLRSASGTPEAGGLGRRDAKTRSQRLHRVNYSRKTGLSEA